MNTNARKIWDTLLAAIGNEYGVAGLIGNLEAESGLKPNNLQNTYETILGMTDSEYTNAVDDGSYSEDSFVNDSAGYGLAQWTFYSRKQNLYNWKNTWGTSIADLDMQLAFLITELQNDYTGLYERLKNVTSVTVASTMVLVDFENPADQSESVKSYRASLGQKYYDAFSTGGTGVLPEEPEEPEEPTDDNIYSLIEVTHYKTGQLSENQITFLKSITIGDIVRIKTTFNHNKRQVGRNFFGARLTLDDKEYIIRSVEKDGYIKIALNNDTVFYKILNPKYLKGV